MTKGRLGQKDFPMRYFLTAALTLTAGMAAAETQTLKADIWADNWFSMYANGKLVIEDSVPITTEKSFNAETTTFTADLPMTLAFEIKDFKENDTGLEYIGTDRQQMGDGGFIAQFHDAASGKIVAATDTDVRCLVIHRAPIERSCADETNPVAGEGACGFVVTETPANWQSADFDDSTWPNATKHSTWEVSPKDGYDKIDWDWSAKLIWSEDLVQDNTLLCRMTIGG